MSAKWVASLSNGETVDEDKLQAKINEDAKQSGSIPTTAWQFLLKRLREDKELEIRHIKLIVNGIEYNTPTYGANGRYNNDANAKSFWVNRRAVFIPFGNKVTHGNDVIEASWKVGEYRHHIIVDVDSNMTWTAVTHIDNKQTVNAPIRSIMGDDY